jgi:hypothetical protein
VIGVPDVRAAVLAAGFDRQRAMIQTLMTVRIMPGYARWRGFDPEKDVDVVWKT